MERDQLNEIATDLKKQINDVQDERSELMQEAYRLYTHVGELTEKKNELRSTYKAVTNLLDYLDQTDKDHP